MTISLAPRLARSWRRFAPLRPRDAGPRPRESGTRRLLNIAVASLGLALTLPVMLAIALAIRLTSPGPVLYRQVRIGLDRRSGARRPGSGRRARQLGGRPFTMYKFRTMVVAPPGDAREVWAARGDARVTPVGRVLRQFRLDELPQLWNVLVGDMNIVGPRPEQPAIFERLRHAIPGYERRQRVRPGITGWAQINQGYDTSLDDVQRKVAFDLEYVGRQSAFEDLRIMLRTLPVMALRRGAL